MLRLTIKLVVFGLLAHGVYRVAPPFWNYFRFRDAVTEAATYAHTPGLNGRKQTPEQLLDRLEKVAEQMNVPLGREDFQLRMDTSSTVVDARYTLQLEYLPRTYKPYEFVVHAESGTPSKYRAVAP